MNDEFTTQSLELCRLCGVYDYVEVDILDDGPLTGLNFRDKVFRCTGVWIKRNDKLTTKLCLRCFKEIQRIDLFRSFCATTNYKIRLEFGSECASDSDGMGHQPTTFFDIDSSLSMVQAIRQFERDDNNRSRFDGGSVSFGPGPEAQKGIKVRRKCTVKAPNVSEENGIRCILWSDEDSEETNNISGIDNGMGKKQTIAMGIDAEHSLIKDFCRTRPDNRSISVAAHPHGEAESFVPKAEGRKIGKRGLCAKNMRKSAPAAAPEKEIQHILLSDDIRTVIRSGIERRKKNATKKGKKRIKRKSTKSNQLNRFKVNCRYRRCSLRFDCVDAMEFHREIYHMKKANREFCCHLCQKTWKRRENAQRHMYAVHVGLKPLKCTFPDCTKSFSDRSNLRGHINATHTQTNAIDCPMCTKPFYRKGCLNRHKAYKHGDGDQNFCHLCHKRRLKLHFDSLHIGQSPFKCHVAGCTKGYGTERGLKIHINSVHTQNVSFDCTKCSFKSYYKNSLRVHLLRYHGKNGN